MNAIIPLAGPDFVHPRHGIRPLVEVEGEPLVRRAITSRSWWRDGTLRPGGLVFVMRDVPEAATVEEHLRVWFEGARIVRLSDPSGGALLSSLAGTALLRQPQIPVCVDLVDILYDCPPPLPLFQTPDVGAVLPWFTSDEPCYSYAAFGTDGSVVQTVEKRVISSHASAGTYLFRDAAAFLTACAHSLEHTATLAHKGALFVCPAMNGIIAHGQRVLPVEVANVRSVSKSFAS